MSVIATGEENELESFLSKSFLDLETVDINLYRSKNLLQHNFSRRMYGGQIIGQAMVAASKSIPDGQHLHSFHSYFLQPGDSKIPILYHVEDTRDGRTYTARNIKATQNGKLIFTMEASFKLPEDVPFSYQLSMKDVQPFDEVPEFMEAISQLKEQGGISELQFMTSKDWSSIFPIDVKWIDVKDNLYSSPRHPRRQLWFRARGHINEHVNHNIHKCCIGYMADNFLIPTSLLPNAPLTSKKIYQASIDHCMWFHSPCRADEWMLLDIRTESIGDGRTFCHGLIWNQQGTLVTTITQEGVQRVASKL